VEPDRLASLAIDTGVEILHGAAASTVKILGGLPPAPFAGIVRAEQRRVRRQVDRDVGRGNGTISRRACQ
jgi:hypothetical protein